MAMKLYCFGESGNSYKAALTMTLAGVDWTPVFVNFFHGDARSPEFRALNEMGEVPVLRDGDEVLSQSGLIQYHIAEKTGKLLPQDHHLRQEVMRWVLWDNHKMSSQAGTLRFLMNFVPEEKRPQEVIRWLSGRLRDAFKVLDSHLEGRDFIVNDLPSLADTACCGYLYYPEPFTFDRKAWPNIDRWLDNIAALPGWKHPYDLMPGRPSDRGL
ncbi:glutathione S-transferase [Haematobacter massiliensis]|uniref:glutathione S-transferase family protein n=1 Tax=Haematobacter massiliensis TaxID=195105 RepID=UPI000B4A446C|nr:glutathione S-transferase family protein [Haematobacter massiliensis]OWJ73639.1 glutathione S-transferase [Haematobacter massiliensis]